MQDMRKELLALTCVGHFLAKQGRIITSLLAVNQERSKGIR